MQEWVFFISYLQTWGTENAQWIVLKNWTDENGNKRNNLLGDIL